MPGTLPFVCPTCPEAPALEERADELRCPRCGRSWKQRDGLWFFSDDAYWGEMPEADMRALLARIDADGFDAGMAGLQRTHPHVFNFALDAARADWRFAMPLRPTDRVLDVGCGMGGNTFGLAPRVAEVVSFDLSALRARFVQKRAAHAGVANVSVFVADFMELPLPENSFDVIVFNGILEWVGQSRKFSDPLEVQRWVLAKCFRLLRPGGRMYIGIENRFSFTYLLGSADHIGLSWTSWMPRPVARAYCRLRIGKDYRTYTHGKRGYEKMLRDAGFAGVRTFLPFPGYNAQRVILPFDDLACMRYALSHLMGSLGWKKRLVRFLSALPSVLRVYRYFFFSYDVFGTKPGV